MLQRHVDSQYFWKKLTEIVHLPTSIGKRLYSELPAPGPYIRYDAPGKMMDQIMEATKLDFTKRTHRQHIQARREALRAARANLGNEDQV
jgi:hypothetical protein